MPPSKRRAVSNRIKKKRQFFGVRKQDIGRAFELEGSGPSRQKKPDTSSTPRSRTAKKLLNSSFEKIIESEGILTRRRRSRLGLSKLKKPENADGYSILDVSLLQKAFQSSAICSFCKKTDSKLTILKDNRKQHGLAEKLIIKCSACLQETSFHSSRKLDRGKFEINARSVVASNTLKGGRKILSSFCGIMNLPSPLAKASYARNLKSTASISQEEAEKQMNDAAKRIRKIVLEQNPNADKEDDHGAISVAVSLDGTWQKRGYSSKFGIVVVVLVDTGEVVDYEVLSMHCHECKKHEHDDKSSEVYKRWKENHNNSCQINYEGSSGGMEGAGAVKIFKRSIERRGLKYTTFVGDGDSDTFKVVSEEINKTYGDQYKVVKEECIGHIQKRMGNALRTLVKDTKGKKLSDNKTIGGKGRLTKEKIDSIQRYYGKAIRSNSGNLSQMQTAILAIFHHSVMHPTNDNLKEQHKFCPKGKDSWCKFNADLESGNKTYDGSKRLPSSFYDILKPIFSRLSSKELLERCLKGVTQNANESFNHMVWERCPKTTFCGKVRIECAVAEAVCCFNTGAGSKALILKAAGVENVGKYSLASLQEEDHIRQVSASQKITKKYKYWRINKKKSKKNSNKSLMEHYEPGAFDSRGEKSVASKKRKMDDVSSFRKRNKSENGSFNASFAIIESNVTDLPITFAVPLEHIEQM